jgi:hypothetical protein
VTSNVEGYSSPRQPSDSLFDWESNPWWEEAFDDAIFDARVQARAVASQALAPVLEGR